MKAGHTILHGRVGPFGVVSSLSLQPTSINNEKLCLIELDTMCLIGPRIKSILSLHTAKCCRFITRHTISLVKYVCSLLHRNNIDYYVLAPAKISYCGMQPILRNTHCNKNILMTCVSIGFNENRTKMTNSISLFCY